MRTELRFLLAIGLVLLVLIGTNYLFPPADRVVPPVTPGEAAGDENPSQSPEDRGEELVLPSSFERPAENIATESGIDLQEVAVGGSEVTVTGPLYRYRFSTQGARVEQAVLSRYDALNGDGPVQLVPQWSTGLFGRSLVVGADTLDLARARFHVEPEAGLDLISDPETDELRFVYEHPSGSFQFEVKYKFDPDSYVVEVSGGTDQIDRGVVVTELGPGLSLVEADSTGEKRMAAYVHRNMEGSVRSTLFSGADPEVVVGPLDWIALRNRFFVLGVFGEVGPDNLVRHFGQLTVNGRADGRVTLSASQELQVGGRFGHSVYLGPQDHELLQEVGRGFNDVNPVGWAFLRPIISPIVSVVLTVLVFLHESLAISYGWALVIFGVAMRIVLFPLNHKAMKAQLRNMAVQPQVKEIQAKYKDDKRKQQEEMMRLYKEQGFNPLGGCVPMLLPWPVLIALFFVFQNTIELRGVPFLWLPDLAGPDPFYALPLLLGASMWFLQWVSLRTIDNPNPTMKMMMWMMPIGMVVMFIWFRWASGLSLYYLTANVATVPQQMFIANQRKKMQGQPPPPKKQRWARVS